MASKITLLFAIIVSTVLSMPTENRIKWNSNIPISHDKSDIDTSPRAQELMKTFIDPVSSKLEFNKLEMKKPIEESPGIFEKRSIRINEKEEISENDEDDKILSEIENKSNLDNTNQDDDLETAAGTNILRPLFVYRQQLAYRERIRKASRRREVPNF